MLDKYRVSQIIALLNEGHGIKTVARMTGVSRNTVRRFQRNIPRKGHHARSRRHQGEGGVGGAAAQAGLNAKIATPSTLIKAANKRRIFFPLRLPLSTLLPSNC